MKKLLAFVFVLCFAASAFAAKIDGTFYTAEVPEGWTNAEATFTRSGSNSAPAAKAPAQTTRSSAGHSAPSLQNPFSARRPVEEAIPFLGQREPKPTR